MPWWIWLVLVVFMILVLALGAWYVFVHAMSAMRIVSRTGAQVMDRVNALSDSGDSSHSQAEPPIFTLPLREAADRYEQAHIEVLNRKAAQRERHARIWHDWKQFNK